MIKNLNITTVELNRVLSHSTFVNIQLDKVSSEFKIYIEELTMYRKYNVFEIEKFDEWMCLLMDLNLRQLSFVTFLQYITIITMYKDDSRLQQLLNFYKHISCEYMLDLFEYTNRYLPNYKFHTHVHPLTSLRTIYNIDQYEFFNIIEISKCIEQSTIKWCRKYAILTVNKTIEIPNITSFKVTGITGLSYLIELSKYFIPIDKLDVFIQYLDSPKTVQLSNTNIYELSSMFPEYITSKYINQIQSLILYESEKMNLPKFIDLLYIVKQFKLQTYIYEGQTIKFQFSKMNLNLESYYDNHIFDVDNKYLILPNKTNAHIFTLNL